jgi:uncharacterized membrane protein (DUF4010 family)
VPTPVFDAQALWAIAVATLGGMAIGVERQWSGHAAGPRARFAGIRTFTLLGLLSGLCGWLWTVGLTGLSSVILAGAGGLVVVAYLSASRRDVDGTTEVAAFVVLTAGITAGIGLLRLASGIIAVTALLLVEKRRLHAWVRALDRTEVRAAARFAVMAAVVLPLLPQGPYGPAGTIKPQLLWALVLFFSALSFVGYLARRTIGAERGYALTGTLGGMLSSTSVTLTYARLSRVHPESGTALASGVLGANAMLFPRVLLATSLLAWPLTTRLWPAFVVPAVIAGVLALRGLRHTRGAGPPGKHLHERNPLQIKAALQMAVLFQVVLFGVAFTTTHFGQAGVYAAAGVLGLTDMDALTVSMAHQVTAGTSALVAARAVAIGVLSNTVVKLLIALAIGRGRFRPLTVAGLATIGLALGAALWLSFVWG